MRYPYQLSSSLSYCTLSLSRSYISIKVVEYVYIRIEAQVTQSAGTRDRIRERKTVIPKSATIFIEKTSQPQDLIHLLIFF